MSAARLLQRLREAGVTVIADGKRLRVQDPRHALTPALHADIRQQTRDLLALLDGEATSGPTHQRFVVFARNPEICHLLDERDSERSQTTCGVYVPQETHNRYRSGREVPTLFDERPAGYRVCHTCATYTPFRDYEADADETRRQEWEASGSRSGCVYGTRHTLHWYFCEAEGRYWCRECYPERVAAFLKPMAGYEWMVAPARAEREVSR